MKYPIKHIEDAIIKCQVIKNNQIKTQQSQKVFLSFTYDKENLTSKW